MFIDVLMESLSPDQEMFARWHYPVHPDSTIQLYAHDVLCWEGLFEELSLNDQFQALDALDDSEEMARDYYLQFARPEIVLVFA